MSDIKPTLPLGLMKQAMMKLDSAITDVRECIEDDDISSDEKETFEQIAEVCGSVQATMLNMVMKEMSEEDFLREDIALDQIDSFPGDSSDIMDEII